MMKKKLLIATDNFLPRWDGIARFLAEIIPRIKEDFDITIIAPDFEGDYSGIKGVEVVRVPLSSININNFAFAKKPKNNILKEFVKESDIIFVQTIGNIGKSAIVEAKKQKKRLVGFNHSIEWELVPNAVENGLLQKLLHSLTIRRAKKLYNLFGFLIAPSDEIKEKFSWYKIRPRKEVVHLGVDIKKFKPTVNKNDAKKKIGIDPSIRIISYVGRLGREKDLKTLFRAYIRLRKDFEDIRLLIVGDGVESIRNMFRSREDVIFIGETNDVVPYLQASDIYVLPSLTETTSLSTLEAMACGAVPICTHVGLVKKYIKHGKNGLLFKKRNVYMLTKRIEKLLNDPNLRKELSKNAVNTVKKDFDWDITAKKIKDILNRP